MKRKATHLGDLVCVSKFDCQVPLIKPNAGINGFLHIVCFDEGSSSLFAQANRGKLAANVLEQIVPFRNRVHL